MFVEPSLVLRVSFPSETELMRKGQSLSGKSLGGSIFFVTCRLPACIAVGTTVGGRLKLFSWNKALFLVTPSLPPTPW